MTPPEWRADPITGQWVIIAPDRAARPNALTIGHEEDLVGIADCPFCEGRESQTPPEVQAIREPGSLPDAPGWRVRVFPNRYPALRCDEDHSIAPPPGTLAGIGVHELIVESPRHVRCLTALSLRQLAEALTVYRDRLTALRRDSRIVSGLLFKNVGSAAGASVEHTHTQLLGMNLIPPTLAKEFEAARQYDRQTGRCLFCDWQRREVAEGLRLVHETGDFVAVAAYAGRLPYETWLLPRSHRDDFSAETDSALDEFAVLLHSVLRQLRRVVGQELAYNWVIHTAPLRPPLPPFHWHLELLPRLTMAAGFEWGTGSAINPIAPEAAARQLREAREGGV